MTETAYTSQIENNEDEIDLIAIAKKLWNSRKTIFIATGIGLVLGVLVAILSPKVYTVSTVMVPQVGSKSASGGLSSLAALAGIDLGSTMSSGDISPLIYPQIVASTPFKLELMNTAYDFKEVDHPVSFYEYYTKFKKPTILGTIKKYTIGLPFVILNVFKGESKDTILKKSNNIELISLTKTQEKVSKMLEKIVTLDVDAKQGYITLNVSLDDRLVCAQLAQKAQEILQREIIRFKVQKAQADLDFIQKRYNEIKSKAEGYQVGIAQKNDQYKNLVSTVPQVQTTRLQTQYGIASTVFQEIAKQLEQAKIQVKRDTPTFTIIQPVTIPIESSKPNKPLLVIVFLLLGVIIGSGIVFGKEILINFKNKWNFEENQIA